MSAFLTPRAEVDTSITAMSTDSCIGTIKDYKLLQSTNLVEKLAMFNFFSKEVIESAMQDINVSYDDVFEGIYGDFGYKDINFLSQKISAYSSYNSSKSYSQYIVMSGIDPASVALYKECVKQNLAQVVSWIQDQAGNIITIRAKWSPGTIDAAVNLVEFGVASESIVGGKLLSPSIVDLPDMNKTRDFSFLREEGKDFAATIYAKYFRTSDKKKILRADDSVVIPKMDRVQIITTEEVIEENRPNTYSTATSTAPHTFEAICAFPYYFPKQTIKPTHVVTGGKAQDFAHTAIDEWWIDRNTLRGNMTLVASPGWSAMADVTIKYRRRKMKLFVNGKEIPEW